MKYNNTDTIRQKGFTLIELLLYVSIVGSLLIALTGFFAFSTQTRVKNQSIAEVNQQGAYAMELVLQTIRNASSITAPAAAGTGTSVTLVVTPAATSPTIMDLDVATQTLRIKEGTAAYIPLTNDKVRVTSLTFSNLTRAGTPGIVRVAMTIQRYNPGSRNEFDYTKTFTSTAALRWP